MVALNDPIRQNMKEMIKEANDANIDVTLISGDNLMTAAAVACDVGIIEKEEFERVKRGESDIVMSADRFRQITGEVIRDKDDVEDGAEATVSYTLSQDGQKRFN